MKKIIRPLACVLIFAGNTFSQSTENKISFAGEPFSKHPKEQKEFNWDKPVYAKLKTEKPLKNYAKTIAGYEMQRFNINGVYSSYLEFMCIPGGEDASQRSNTEITLYLTDSELEKSEVNIDIMPLKKDATTFYGTGFYAELAKNDLVKYGVETGNSTGKKTTFTVYLLKEKRTRAVKPTEGLSLISGCS